MISDPLKRLAAHFVDGFLMFGLAMLILVVIGASMQMVFDGGIAVGILAMFVGMVAIQVYFWNQSTSLGKHLMGMVVVDKESHEPVGLLKMAAREVIGKWISGMVFSLGYLWILIDEDNQAWHDKLITSIVVDRNK